MLLDYGMLTFLMQISDLMAVLAKNISFFLLNSRLISFIVVNL